MYIPAHFNESDVTVLHALIGSHPLGAWVTPAGGGLVVNHIPWLLDPTLGQRGTLVGHVARPNPVWKTCSTEVASVVIFQGTEHYISPSWYASKAETAKVVPTWNYAVVHAHGIPRVFDDRDRLRAHVTALTDRHEAMQDEPWAVADAPAEFIDNLLGGIVGIEIPIASLSGKWKVSQNRNEADRHAVTDALRRRADGRSLAMAELVAQPARRPDDDHS
jgi:transcriptional regulator